jgi:drug/metabolite transporter (DMT)-like permease
VEQDRKSRLIGYAALAITIVIWSAWIVYTRLGMRQAMPISVLILVRMIVPAVLLLPVVMRSGIFGGGRSTVPVLLTLSAGIPHILLSAIGLSHAPSSDYAALVPGTMPVFVAVLAAVFFSEKLGWLRAFGLAFSFLGVMAITWQSFGAANADANFGHLIFLTAGLNYAIFTLAFRRSGFTPVEGAAFVSFWSCLMILPFGLMPAVEYLRAGHTSEIIFQAVMQGFLSNLVALVTYSEGVRRLGASKAAAFAALVPVMATLFAIPVLGEWPDVWGVVGVVLASLGVLLASGVLAFNGKNGRTAAG